MGALRALFAELGFPGAQTVVQSGNVVFYGGGRSAASLETLFERETAQRFGLTCDYVIRSGAQIADAVQRNPFAREAHDDPGRLAVLFSKKTPCAGNVRLLQSAISGPEIVKSAGKHLYAYYPEGMGRSKLTTAVIERALDTRVTARNWNTVLKIAALL